LTSSAREELQEALERTPQVRVQGGVPLEVAALGAGKLLTYDPALLETAPTGGSVEPHVGWDRMVQAALGVAQMKPLCRVSDPRLRAVSLTRSDGTLGVFIFNLSGRAVLGDLHFGTEVSVSDLASRLAAAQAFGEEGEAEESRGKTPVSSYFQLEVPPCGVLPIAVEAVGESMEERELARLSAGLLRQGVLEAAHSELAGFDGGAELGGGDSLWN
jgi:hypothetical protein